MSFIPPIIFNDFDEVPFHGFLNYLYDPAVTGFRAVTPGDFVGASGAAGVTQDAIVRGQITGVSMIAAGHKSITIFTSSDWIGDVQSVYFPANASETYPYIQGDTLSSLTISGTTGILYYSTIG